MHEGKRIVKFTVSFEVWFVSGPGSREMTSNESSQRSSPEPEGGAVKTQEKIEPAKDNNEIVNQENSEGIDETIPDCSNWSCDEVYSYFLKYVLPEEANVFKDQVIEIKPTPHPPSVRNPQGKWGWSR